MTLKIAFPRKNCPSCRGAGYILYADSFDRDNWSVCTRCRARAKKKKVKLAVRYPAGLTYV